MNRILVLAFMLVAGRLAAAQEVEHAPTIEKAIEAAKKDKKSILVDFTGSDWCGWCIKLHEEVFDTAEWKKAAAGKFVFVELDFPQRKAIDAEQKKYNDAQAKTYGVEGYPTILVLDSEGRLYARTGYQAGGPEEYVKHLDEFGKRKTEIAELSAKAKSSTAADKLKALESLIAKLKEWQIDASYVDLKEQYVNADAKSDKAREFLKDLALHFGKVSSEGKYTKYLKMLREVDAAGADFVEVANVIDKDVMPLLQKADWKGGLEKLVPMKERKGEAGQQVLYYCGLCEYKLNHKDEAVKLLEAAVKAAPGTELAKSIGETLEQIK